MQRILERAFEAGVSATEIIKHFLVLVSVARVQGLPPSSTTVAAFAKGFLESYSSSPRLFVELMEELEGGSDGFRIFGFGAKEKVECFCDTSPRGRRHLIVYLNRITDSPYHRKRGVRPGKFLTLKELAAFGSELLQLEKPLEQGTVAEMLKSAEADRLKILNRWIPRWDQEKLKKSAP